jgi:hypothetical protein
MATPKDAELILELYKLRTEATMRESRDIMAKFQPTSFAEIQALQRAAGSRENAAWRQTRVLWMRSCFWIRMEKTSSTTRA